MDLVRCSRVFPEGAMVVLDSLPLANDADQTLLPCSPSLMMESNIVHETLSKMASHENFVPAASPEADEVWCQNNVKVYLFDACFYSQGLHVSLYLVL